MMNCFDQTIELTRWEKGKDDVIVTDLLFRRGNFLASQKENKKALQSYSRSSSRSSVSPPRCSGLNCGPDGMATLKSLAVRKLLRSKAMAVETDANSVVVTVGKRRNDGGAARGR